MLRAHASCGVFRRQKLAFQPSTTVTLSGHAARGMFRRKKLGFPALLDCHPERDRATLYRPTPCRATGKRPFGEGLPAGCPRQLFLSSAHAPPCTDHHLVARQESAPLGRASRLDERGARPARAARCAASGQSPGQGLFLFEILLDPLLFPLGFVDLVAVSLGLLEGIPGLVGLGRQRFQELLFLQLGFLL